MTILPDGSVQKGQHAKLSRLDTKFNTDAFIKKNNRKFTEVYNFGEELGEGSYGTVKVCQSIQNGSQRAVKIVKKKDLLTGGHKEEMFNEITNLKELNHPNIIKFYEFFEDEDNYYLVTDLYKGGEILKELEKREQFSEEDAQKVVK